MTSDEVMRFQKSENPCWLRNNVDKNLENDGITFNGNMNYDDGGKDAWKVEIKRRV